MSCCIDSFNQQINIVPCERWGPAEEYDWIFRAGLSFLPMRCYFDLLLYSFAYPGGLRGLVDALGVHVRFEGKSRIPTFPPAGDVFRF